MPQRNVPGQSNTRSPQPDVAPPKKNNAVMKQHIANLLPWIELKSTLQCSVPYTLRPALASDTTRWNDTWRYTRSKARLVLGSST
jgi:hypothetical protein